MTPAISRALSANIAARTLAGEGDMTLTRTARTRTTRVPPSASRKTSPAPARPRCAC